MCQSIPVIDNNLIVADDKIDNNGSSITFGKNFDNTSSVYFNFGLDIIANNIKKLLETVT
jgi:hypothetical protein